MKNFKFLGKEVSVDSGILRFIDPFKGEVIVSKQEDIDRLGYRFDKNEVRQKYMWDNAIVDLKYELIDNNPYEDIGMRDAYQVGVEDSFIELSRERLLPSRWQLGDLVSVRFKPSLVIDTAEIIKVHFSKGKILYDLEVRIPYKENPESVEDYTTTRFYNVDSAIISEV
jgi:hypothetical protein